MNSDRYHRLRQSVDVIALQAAIQDLQLFVNTASLDTSNDPKILERIETAKKQIIGLEEWLGQLTQFLESRKKKR